MTTPPIEKRSAAVKIQFLGEKIWAKRAATGDMEDKAI